MGGATAQPSFCYLPVKNEVMKLFPQESPSIKAEGLDVWTLGDFGAFYASHRRNFLAHASRLLKDSLRAEEVVQEALIRVMLAAPELTSESHATAYVHRVIENLVIDLYRLEGRRPNLVVLDEDSIALERLPQQDLSDEVAAADDAAIIRQALSLLSPAERAALVMWEVEGRTSIEIANELGIKESSVRHTVSRARASLRKVMSQLIIDEERGLTALDLLSKTYKKVSAVAKESSKAALSVALLIFALVGFNSFYGSSSSTPITQTENELSGTSAIIAGQSQLSGQSSLAASEDVKVIPDAVASNSEPTRIKGKSNRLSIPGLDRSGIPVGFSISDGTGSIGEAYFREKPSLVGEADGTISQVMKTTTGVANVFLLQRIKADSDGISYEPTLSMGQEGMWVPLNVRVDSAEIKRSPNGNYLVTAFIAVESVIETPIKIAAKAGGRDLTEAPRQVITRLVLDPSKTQVLSQAVYVVEKGVEA